MNRIHKDMGNSLCRPILQRMKTAEIYYLETQDTLNHRNNKQIHFLKVACINWTLS